MGGNPWTHTAAWTFVYLVQVLTADRSLFQDLGLSALPDATKINISQDEYVRMMDTYLDARRSASGADPTTIPKLVTFERIRTKKDVFSKQARDSPTILKFPIGKSTEDVDSAHLRILAAPLRLAAVESASVVRVRVLQVLGARRRRLVDEKNLYLSRNLTKWCEFDITSAVQSWLTGDRNLGLELACIDCGNGFEPERATVSALVYPPYDPYPYPFPYRTHSDFDPGSVSHRRVRRSSAPFRSRRATDCRQSRTAGSAKRRCCRHDMSVKFADLKFPEMRDIVQPKTYEAGFCQGQCPPNFNHATNHSRIQSLIHQMNRKGVRQPAAHHRVPKACCTPSKLEPLEILRVNPADSTKLIVEKWDNMQVVECACS